MPIQPEERYALKLRALYYLYEKNYTQSNIAERLGISRVTLGKLLDEARKEGMVKIEIIDTKGSVAKLKLEEQFKDMFGLDDIRLVECPYTDSSALIRRLASEAANYLEHNLHSGMSIGVAWGRTLNIMEEYLKENHSIQDLKIYSLVGGSYNVPDFQPNLLVQRIVEKYSGTTYTIPAPFMCQNPDLCQAIKLEPQIANTLNASHNLDLTLVGIGEEPKQDKQHFSHYSFDDDIVQELADAGAVGDICGNFFDIDGTPCKTSISNRIVSIDIRELPQHKKVIGIGGGPEKVRSILGALNGHYLKVLITDIATAKKVLSLVKSSRNHKD